MTEQLQRILISTVTLTSMTIILLGVIKCSMNAKDAEVTMKQIEASTYIYRSIPH